MAKKSRTPNPPRRVQAPKQRHTPREGLTDRQRRLILYGVAGAGIVALAIVLVVVLAGGKSAPAGNPSAVGPTLAAAGCSFSTTAASPSNQHIGSLNQRVTYATYPPVSGRHYVTPAIWGNYTQEVDPRVAVHNLEHGAVVIWVGPGVSESERRQISDFYDESPDAMLVTPIADTAKGVKYPQHARPDSKVYLTAWTAQIKGGNLVGGTNVIATCPRFDETAFRAFRDEFRGKGPERYPLSSLTPGT